MNKYQQKIDALTEFRARDKFSTESWNKRGLNPSDDIICEMLHTRFYYTATELLDSLKKERPKRKLKTILRQRLGTFNKYDYDTEEREYIAVLFFEISNILEIDFRRKLNCWLYGIIVMALMDIHSLFKRPEKNIVVHEQQCVKCKMSLTLSTDANGKKSTGFDYWIISKCFNCNGYNLIDNDYKLKSYALNSQPVEHLSKEEFTFEQAMIRLEQLSYFRK